MWNGCLGVGVLNLGFYVLLGWVRVKFLVLFVGMGNVKIDFRGRSWIKMVF